MEKLKTKKSLKYILLLIFILIVIFLWMRNLYEIKTTNFQCTGELLDNVYTRDVEEITVFLKIEEWGPGLLWRSQENNGSAWLEIPNRVIVYYSNIQQVGQMIHIYRYESFAGNFSTLSKSLMVQADNFGFFTGSCVIID